MKKTFAIYTNYEIYEITINGAYIEKIAKLSLSTPDSVVVKFRSLPLSIQEDILSKLETEDAKI